MLCKTRVFEKNVRRLLEHNKEKKQGGGGWRKSHNEKINDLCSRLRCLGV